MSVYMYAYTFIYACVWVYICTRVGAFYLYCSIALLHARVSQVFLNTCMPVCGGIGSGFFPACSWLALVAGVGGYVLAGVEKGGFPSIFLYFGGC